MGAIRAFGAERPAKGAAASLLRAILLSAEPFYTGAMVVRNFLYSNNLKRSHRLPRPVVSIGNITTGGTGKTPVVRWLAERLRDAGRHPAILLRGYRLGDSRISDEQVMLDRHLNDGNPVPVVVHANPDRLAGSRAVLRDHDEVDVFLLDDGFQHRRIRRDFDLVLINATEPFGFGHVIPRGLLREPLAGLRRADAFVLTHASQAPVQSLRAIESALCRYNSAAPVYYADHVHTALRTPTDARRLDELRELRYFAFSGIGNPESLHRQLQTLPGQYVGHRWFPDHHPYDSQDLADLRCAALAAGADVILTTEKDWVKLASLPTAGDSLPPIWRLDVAIGFRDGDENRLFGQIADRLGKRG